MINHITIIGMGALGIMYGSHFCKTLGPDKVEFIAAGERLARYQREGAYCNGEKCPFQVSDTPRRPAEVLLFAVKSTALEEAMELAAPWVGEETTILSVLNGVTSEELLEQRFGGEKVLYTVVQGMDAVREDNRLTSTHMGQLFLGIPEEDYFDRGARLEEVADFFRRGQLPFTVDEDILHRMWCKFMLNVGINQVCMVYETTYGGAQQPGPVRETMLAAMNEARKVAACQGVLVTQKDMAEYVAVMDGLNPQSMPSMRQDGLAHRPSEVALFAGTVLELAHRFGMKAPVNQQLFDQITAMEASWSSEGA